MRIRRGLLFWGLLLIPLGAIPLLERAGAIQAERLTEVWRLWPLALILVGLAVLLGRRQAGLVAVVVAALALGGLGGSAIASGTGWLGPIGVCAGTSDDMEAASDDGTVDGTMDEVTLDLDCGSLRLTTRPGSDWRVDARYLGPAPDIAGVGASLRVTEPGDDLRHRQEWTVEVPDRLGTVDLRANAASTEIALGRATVRRVTASVNAGDLTIDAEAASLDRLDLDLNAGRARIAFGAGPTTGDLSVNAGALELCVPPDMGLRLEVEDQLTFAHDLDRSGLDRDGDSWTRPASGGADTIDLSIDGNAASLTLDPEEGCR